MIMIISWIQFQQHYMKTDQLVHVVEHQDRWCLYATSGMIIIKSEVVKSEKPEENYAFTDRHLNAMNIIKADRVIEQETVKMRIVQSDV